MKRILAVAATAFTFCAAQAHAQQSLAFVTCPVMRDTASVPCWLVEYKDELYYLGAQGEFAGVTAPSLGHQALIEGTPTEARVCGGKVMTDLRVSILPERTASCDIIIPATEAFQIAARPEETASASTSPPPAPAAKLEGSQKFELHYDFGATTTGRQPDLMLQAVAYIRENPKAEVRVQGYRAAVQLTGGAVLEEADGIDLLRTHEVIETLTALGLDTDLILTVDNPAPELGDHTRRRAVIEVVMSGADDHSEH